MPPQLPCQNFLIEDICNHRIDRRVNGVLVHQAVFLRDPRISRVLQFLAVIYTLFFMFKNDIQEVRYDIKGCHFQHRERKKISHTVLLSTTQIVKIQFSENDKFHDISCRAI